MDAGQCAHCGAARMRKRAAMPGHGERWRGIEDASAADPHQSFLLDAASPHFSLSYSMPFMLRSLRLFHSVCRLTLVAGKNCSRP